VHANLGTINIYIYIWLALLVANTAALANVSELLSYFFKVKKDEFSSEDFFQELLQEQKGRTL